MPRPSWIAVLFLSVATSVVTAADRPSIEVLDEGQAVGRRSLRFSFAEGQRFLAVMNLQTDIAMQIGGKPLPAVDLPATRLEQVCDVIDVDDAGVAKMILRITDHEVISKPGTPAAVVQAIEAAMEGCKRIKGSVSMDDRGHALDSSFTVEGEDEVPPMLDQMIEMMRQSVQQISAPLPNEPIGLGGRWRTVVDTALGGIRQNIEANYTVTELTSKGVKLALSMSQSADPQDLNLPTLPPGTTARLGKLSGEGAGEVEIEFAQPLPVKASNKLESVMDMTIMVANDTQDMHQNVVVSMTMTGEPVAAEIESTR